MKDLLYKLFEQKNLSSQEAYSVMLRIADGEFNNEQLAAFMTVFLMRSITTDELTGFRNAILERRIPINFNDEKVIDIVGTGGDGKNTFNISTASCFVVAGTGRKVVKHGNYGSSSVSGASNVLEHYGVKFTSDNEKLHQSLDKCGVSFLHAPLFSPAMKSVGPVRKSLAVRTFFNILGPLVNPIIPKYQLLGVYNLKLMRLYNYIAQMEKINCTIVHSLDGYDEISLTDSFKVIMNDTENIYNPSDLGFIKSSQDSLFGGDTIDDAAIIFKNVLQNKGTKAQTDCVLANAAFAIKTLEPNIDIREAIEETRKSIVDGKADATFRKFLELNN